MLRHSVPAGTECPIKLSNFSPTYADDLQLEVLEKRIYLNRLFYQTIGLPESVVSLSRQLLHTVDLYGRLVNPAQIPSGIYIQWYSDGSYEKVWLDE